MSTLDDLSSEDAIAATADLYVQLMDTSQDEVEAAYDAFLLDPGMGPMTYLTADGRVLQDERTWDGDAVCEVQDAELESKCIVVGAKKTGIRELLDLLPERPPDAVICGRCDGARWSLLFNHLHPCMGCGALGWVRGLP